MKEADVLPAVSRGGLDVARGVKPSLISPWDGSVAPSALSQLDISWRRRRVGVDKIREKRAFLSGPGGTRTCVVSTRCGRKGPGARRPRSRPVSRVMDRSVFLHCRGRGEGGRGLFPPCSVFFLRSRSLTSLVTRHSVQTRSN